ncbi:MAG: bifunctional phosphoribosyl-AMP cyclohydrolase/phosphoribosyl-ATP diphosphatase HisIE [Anaerolineae bacterium]|nr:bifunctional phosphoribosyl-AMP cyclohydrolase/phosphoribosyl-ATP diphosphatase HisIE [Anaerolineae bacterium]
MLKFDDKGLMPAIIQDAISGRVLMMGWMNAESLQKTHESGEVWFFSRSRNELWHKGATSGNVLRVRDIRTDCDADALLIQALPAGPTCHTGEESCFHKPYMTSDGLNDFADRSAQPDALPRAGFLDLLEGVVASRRNASPDTSYTARLFAKGRFKIAQKVGEEGLETAMAGVAQEDERLIDEASDLLFHLLVLLNERQIPLRQVLQQLELRHVK